MNRAQRRAAERQRDRTRAQRRLDPAEAWMRQRIAIVKTDRRDLDEASRRDIMTAIYLCLQRLQSGTLDKGDFVHLIEWNAVAGEIARHVDRQLGQAAGRKAA